MVFYVCNSHFVSRFSVLGVMAGYTATYCFIKTRGLLKHVSAKSLTQVPWTLRNIVQPKYNLRTLKKNIKGLSLHQ